MLGKCIYWLSRWTLCYRCLTQKVDNALLLELVSSLTLFLVHYHVGWSKHFPEFWTNFPKKQFPIDKLYFMIFLCCQMCIYFHALLFLINKILIKIVFFPHQTSVSGFTNKNFIDFWWSYKPKRLFSHTIGHASHMGTWYSYLNHISCPICITHVQCKFGWGHGQVVKMQYNLYHTCVNGLQHDSNSHTWAKMSCYIKHVAHGYNEQMQILQYKHLS